ncbi:glycoside hydrolase family 26 protein [Halomarina pelagica]|uniref:glycoside hydrolase family 26 protein n=1 Tax=Halomarina pelagica TaxID=2961599 RepID=UPI0020C43BFF|nr:glycosyl hydrolase [Halomarina sp. BND7]
MNRRTLLGLGGGALGTVLGGTRLYAAMNDRTTDARSDGSGAASSTPPSDTPSENSGEDAPDAHRFETRDGNVLLGVSPETVASVPLSALERWQGRRNAAIGAFVDVGVPDERRRDVVDGLLTPIWERGSVPHVVWQPYVGAHEATPPTIARDIAAGRHDRTFERWADALDRWLRPDGAPDRRLYLNFAPEMNGDWVPWDASDGETTPSDYVEMWRRVRDVVEGTGVGDDHVQWVWAVNHVGRTAHPIEAFYPGDDYADWCGVHGYNWARWGGWKSPAELYDDALDAVASFTDNPTVLSEYGCSSAVDGGHDPARKGEWIREAFDYVEKRDVRMALWFNYDKETDWAVFGGSRGTEVFDHDGETYNAYEEYRRAVNREGVLPAYAGHPRRLTDEEFRGEF